MVITDAVHRLVSGLFVVEDRGAQALKGIERPVQIYRVVQPSEVRGRLEAAAAARGLTPFVGREAGAFFQNTPFYAVTEMLREFLAWRGDEPVEERLARLEPALELAGLKPAEALPLIAPLLNLPMPEKYPAPAFSPDQQRRRLLATLVEWVLGAARVQPLVIAIEDLHWADPSTLELIQLLVEQGATARLLLLYTARPEFRPAWPPLVHHAQITLNRLSSRNVRTMMGEVAAQKALSEETIATVVERTSGVPLFVEEMTRAVLESGNAKLTGREIPVTLRDLLMARLDRLGPAREVAQLGAVIGREFSYELLHAIHPAPEDQLQAALKAVTDAELLYVRGIPPEAMYRFKHALIQDAAYEALLKTRRRRCSSGRGSNFGKIGSRRTPHSTAHVSNCFKLKAATTPVGKPARRNQLTGSAIPGDFDEASNWLSGPRARAMGGRRPPGRYKGSKHPGRRQSGHLNCRRNNNFRGWRHFPDAFSVWRDRS